VAHLLGGWLGAASLMACGGDDGGATGGTGGSATGGAGAGGFVAGGQPELGGVGGASTGGSAGEDGVGGAGGGEPGGSGGAAAGGRTTGGAGGVVAPDCPDSTDYVGDPAWPHRLEVTDGAEYCGAFDEIRSLDQEYAIKAKIRIAPGTYPLADTAGTYAFALPVCFEGKPGSVMPSFGGAGEVEVLTRENPVTSSASFAHVFNQSLSHSDTGTWSFQGHTS